MSQDFANYNEMYYTKKSPETRDWLAGRIRCEDMASAIAYSLGITSFKEAFRLFDPEKKFVEQAQSLWDSKSRTPKFVLDIGCGRGETSAFYTQYGVRNIGLDPGPGSVKLFNRTISEWITVENKECGYIHKDILSGLRIIEQKAKAFPDTVILVNTLEHIPVEVFQIAYLKIMGWLRKTSGLLIITNILKEYPIKLNNHPDWCHVAEVNDSYYNWLAEFAKRTVYRKKSHLVLEF